MTRPDQAELSPAADDTGRPEARQRRKWRVAPAAALIPAGVLLAVLLIWQAAVALFHVPSYLLPAPTAGSIIYVASDDITDRDYAAGARSRTPRDCGSNGVSGPGHAGLTGPAGEVP